jgi:hypothetical protein
MDEQQFAELIARLDQRLRRFLPGARCGNCQLGHPLLLCRSGEQVLCHDCRLKKRGQRPVELHHVGGRPSELTVEIPANLHALLTWLQSIWRGSVPPGSSEALQFDLVMLKTIGPLFGLDG